MVTRSKHGSRNRKLRAYVFYYKQEAECKLEVGKAKIGRASCRDRVYVLV